MKRLRPLLAALAVVAAACAAGPAVKSAAPPLVIDAVNVEGGAYDVVAKADGHPCLVFLVRLRENDQDGNAQSGRIAGAVGLLYSKLKDKGFNAAVVLLGDDEMRAKIRAYAKEKDIQVPMAVLAPEADTLKPWKFESSARNMLVCIKGGKVTDCLIDVSETDREAIVNAVTRIIS